MEKVTENEKQFRLDALETLFGMLEKDIKRTKPYRYEVDRKLDDILGVIEIRINQSNKIIQELKQSLGGDSKTKNACLPKEEQGEQS